MVLIKLNVSLDPDSVKWISANNKNILWIIEIVFYMAGISTHWERNLNISLVYSIFTYRLISNSNLYLHDSKYVTYFA